MSNEFSRMVRMALFGGLIIASGSALAGEISYTERFALGGDRAAALKELISGTEDYYYYNALQLELDGKLGEAKRLIDAGIKKCGRTGRLIELENRYALKIYEKNPAESLRFITDRLNLHFNHYQKKLKPEVLLPTKLDENQISYETLWAYAISEPRNTDRFEDSAFDALVAAGLNADQRRHLLSRLQRPDYPGVVQLIMADLDYRNSGGFGSHPIHGMLTIEQLEECLKAKPDLIKQTNFINCYLTKLRPGEDVNWKADEAEYVAYLQRLQAFADRLPPSQNSLKANIMYQQLAFNVKKGVVDKALFDQYVKMPRPVHYINPKWLERSENAQTRVSMDASFAQFTQLPPIGGDEQVVRQYLMALLRQAPDFKAYEDYIEYNYLKRLFAEVKLVNEMGDAEQWYALMDNPSMVKALRDRIDVDLLPTNAEYLDPEAEVTLDVAVKNVAELMIKVYELNTTGFYRQNLEEISTDIELDGLTPNSSRNVKYAQAPMCRHEERLAFPEISKPGVYVVELIGNGVSSRSLVRKGSMTFTERIGAAGHVFRVYDAAGELIKDAVMWMAGTEYKADKGEIRVPFSGQPQKQSIVFTHDDFSVLRDFQHLGENYELNAGIFLASEQLVSGKECTVTVRPELLLNGEPIDISVLENPVLTIRSVDLDGLSAEKQVNDFKLENDKDATYTFRVPQRLLSMQIQLSGSVQVLSAGSKTPLSDSADIEANTINKTDKVEDCYLRYADGGYMVELLGRNAEARDGRAVQLQFKHRDFQQVVHTSLKTDANGRVTLGHLKDIAWIRASGPDGVGHTWTIPRDQSSRQSVLHMLAGGTLRIPVMEVDGRDIRTVVSLLETRDGVFVKDYIDKVKLLGGYLVVSGLPAGDYSLMTKPDAVITTIRVTDGKAEGAQLLGKNRVLEDKASHPLQIQNIAVTGKELIIKLANAVEGTRVHVLMTRYVSDDMVSHLGAPAFRYPSFATLGRPMSQYLSGRRIGDEYRYVMERRTGTLFPGNMLARPSLLLNPWSPRSTDTGHADAQGGEQYAAQARYGGRSAGAYGAAYGGVGSEGENLVSSYDFLEEVSPIIQNLVPDKNGEVKVSVEDLPTGQQLHVYAVNASSSVYRQTSLKERPEGTQDLRLTRFLEPAAHFTQQKRTDIVRKGQTFTAADLLSARIEVVDSVGAAYRLLTALNDDETLAEFNFVVNWPGHSKAKKQEIYKKYACHELHLFLAKKDPQFFNEVVRPYLASKKDRTFMDDFLLGKSLDGYLEPWKYSRLNMVERALLAQAVTSQQASTARHLKDRYDLIPLDVEKFNRLFDAALQSSGLEDSESDKLVREAKAQLRDQKLLEASEVELGAPAPAVMHKMLARAKGRSDEKSSQEGMAFAALEAPAPERIAEMDTVMDESGDRTEANRRSRESLRRDMEMRQEIRQLYRKLEKTKEWVESNYYMTLIGAQVGALVGVDAFWKDYAQWDGKSAFLSGNIGETADSFTEIMLALAVLDLPFEAGKHDYKEKDGSLVFTAASDAIVFHKQIRKAEGDVGKSVLLVNQRFFAQNDRYRHEGNEQFDKFVSEEFEKGRVYGCRIVLTNPTSSRRKVDVLQQIPAGAMPVLGGMQTRSMHTVLEAYSTQSQEYYFYFPEEGAFPHYPVHVAQNEEVVAAAEPFTFTVVAEVDDADKESWEYISQYGSEEEVAKYINNSNIDRIDLDLIAWRVRENKDSFEKVVAMLKDRKVYNQTLWSYSIKHNVPARIREFLPNTQLANECGSILQSPLLELDPIIKHVYEHKEYWPLVNARIFKLGSKRTILNEQFYQQYEAFMKVLTYRKDLTDDDEMAVAVFMLFQDRIEEALRYYKAVDAARLSMKIQYDYMTAYMAFYQEDPGLARKVAEKYKDYPVDRWRNLFGEVLAQCDEIGGKSAGVTDKENRDQAQTKLADTSPRLQFEMESSTVKITHANIEEPCTINYYPMDIELLFSREPFVKDVGAQLTVIKPTRSEKIKLGSGELQDVKVPADLSGRNLMIEVTAAGISRQQAYYPNQLKVDVIESYGQLRVVDKKSGKALSKVYVKVYAKTDSGEAKFYKDGYTDLRGRFDYTSLNTDEIDGADKFAILILSDTNGAMVCEAAPPKM